MNWFTVAAQSGEILWCEKRSCDFEGTDYADKQIVEGKGDKATEMVQDGQLIARPEMPASINKSEVAADGADLAVISGVPTGATIEIFGPPKYGKFKAVMDGSETLELSAIHPGEYRIALRLFPFVDKEFIIYAN